MNLFRRLFLRLSDPLLKKCWWQRRYQISSQSSNSPAWLDKLMYCDCAQAIQRYHSTEPTYPAYLWQYSFLACIEKRQRQRAIKHWPYKPLISIQLPVYKTNLAQLHSCLDAVARQLYPHWQLCIVDDGSHSKAIQKTLTDFKKQFPEQVKLVIRPDNLGITATSQEALALTDGEYIALVDHDDYLAPEALYEVVKLLNQAPETDWVYSDNDKIDSHGQRCCLHAKPAWSPELLMTYNYILHLSVIRRTLIQQVGGFRAGFEGSQDHDLYLRLSEINPIVRHIPRVLYSWRQSSASVALSPENKSYAYDAALRALNAALKRRGETGHAIHPPHSWLGSYQIIRELHKPDIDIIFLDSDTSDIATTSQLNQQANITISSQTRLTKNGSAGAQLSQFIKQCRSPYILLLSSTVQFNKQDQLFRLAGNLAPEGVAVSSAKIITLDGQTDHCGLAYQQGTIRYPLRGWPKDLDGIGAYGALPRNTSLGSPLIHVYKTAILVTLIKNISAYQGISATLIALNLELQIRQLRISVDGGIAILNTQQPYQVSISDHDKILLQSHYPHFFNSDDPLYHNDMNTR